MNRMYIEHRGCFAMLEARSRTLSGFRVLRVHHFRRQYLGHHHRLSIDDRQGGGRYTTHLHREQLTKHCRR